jgi:DNA mismatch repair protein MutS
MTTPARRQYLDIKAEYPDAILLYQVGDFYETFDDDAKVAARELQIALTSRGYGLDERVPLAGVPVHAVSTYAARLVARGYKVAICDQVSPPGRGLVQREVTRILTPGTVAEPALVPAGRDNYLVAVAASFQRFRAGQRRAVGLAYVEVSSGAFGCTQWEGEQLPDALLAELERLQPAEILIAEGRPAPWAPEEKSASAADYAREWLDVPAAPTACPTSYFDAESARIRLCRHFAVPTLAAFGCDDAPLATAAAGALVAYLQRMNPALLRSLTGLHTYDTRGYVELDGRTWRALEVVEASRGVSARPSATAQSSTLLATLDVTRTGMGARLLRRLLLQPVHDRHELEARLDAVAELHANPALRERTGAILQGMGDVERLTARIAHGTATPRELVALAAALARAPEFATALRSAQSARLVESRAALDGCEEVRERIDSAVADGAPALGRILREGFSAELDELVQSSADAREWIAALEPRERERTGIKSLRVGYNKVFGYYLEVSHANRGRVPPDYERRQTLTNGERYVTPALKQYEERVLHAEEQIAALESTLYAGLLDELARHQGRLRATAAAVARVDATLSLAEVAAARGYVRPELTDTTELRITAGRHPMLEVALDGREFMPNDLRFDRLADELSAESDASDEASAASARVLLLTGPNMAGKSTYLRQVALIALLAHIGSFVPAGAARIGLVDRIFTRVGAEDDLSAGLSTFMLEMVETAYILRHATARSLVALDEVGRGTSTRDGLAIARAVIEHLHDVVKARTLFATHYHELAQLADTLPSLRVFRMDVAEREGQAIFLHRVVPGVCDASYGVQVARMAGVPAGVTRRADDLLAGPEAERSLLAETRAEYNGLETAGDRWPGPRDTADERLRISHDVEQLLLALASINIASTTPLDGLNLLFSLQQRAIDLLQQRSA